MFCDFMVWTPSGMSVERIEIHKNFSRLFQLWTDYRNNLFSSVRFRMCFLVRYGMDWSHTLLGHYPCKVEEGSAFHNVLPQPTPPPPGFATSANLRSTVTMSRSKFSVKVTEIQHDGQDDPGGPE
ncbi:hypothetical protein PR048_019295 [Dryococelus australis]|uniref:Uncharacterized protein n=1 Tax=Dryococelus australis TaxID=614101 RepID=A0ABQ9H361_9NEOP|nr:hypothetical protein PR048_019295 [Dryococelus australis]